MIVNYYIGRKLVMSTNSDGGDAEQHKNGAYLSEVASWANLDGSLKIVNTEEEDEEEFEPYLGIFCEERPMFYKVFVITVDEPRTKESPWYNSRKEAIAGARKWIEALPKQLVFCCVAEFDEMKPEPVSVNDGLWVWMEQ